MRPSLSSSLVRPKCGSAWPFRPRRWRILDAIGHWHNWISLGVTTAWSPKTLCGIFFRSRSITRGQTTSGAVCAALGARRNIEVGRSTLLTTTTSPRIFACPTVGVDAAHASGPYWVTELQSSPRLAIYFGCSAAVDWMSTIALIEHLNFSPLGG